MRLKRLRQTEYHHRRITFRDTGNVADISISLPSWRTNHSPLCSPRSTLLPISASHPRARYPHMAAVCSFNNNNNFVLCLTIVRPHQGSARSLTTPAGQAIHHFDANRTQIWCNRPSPEQVISHLSATHLPLSGLFECLCRRTA
jgi:hypothetical protein